MDIIHDDYQVHYDAATATVICQGSFRLRGTEEYAPILQVLTAAADAQPATLTLDLRPLRFLNSAGINTLAKFVLHARQYAATPRIFPPGPAGRSAGAAAACCRPGAGQT